MPSVEGTAGNVVLKALQNVIENVRRNHYRTGHCPDLSVTPDSFKTCSVCEGWGALPAQPWNTAKTLTHLFWLQIF